jgi:hypothetical protein
VEGDPEAVLNIGFWMLVLAVSFFAFQATQGKQGMRLRALRYAPTSMAQGKNSLSGML